MEKNKIKSRQALCRLVHQYKSQKKKVVLATGCFDILHSGHIQLFREAKKLGDILIVGANTDKTIRKIKGPTRPIVKENVRLKNIAAVEYVDYVTSFSEQTPTELISALKPHIFVKGGDWSSKELPEIPTLRAHGGKMIWVPIRIQTSTTALTSST